MDEERLVATSDEKHDVERNDPANKDNLKVGMKRSFDVAFLTGSGVTTRTAVESSAPEEKVEEHKSAFSRYVKRFVEHKLSE